jgi:hypothetical protein
LEDCLPNTPDISAVFFSSFVARYKNKGINILDSASRFDSKRLLFFITLQG